ncbi:site-specific DNA-methyltransferase [Enterococcus sp. S86.2]|uniref:DNA-methyltransferase n=1 Tax=Enterococcus sp. S86.2 TaxID=3031299 RepID=UPI0026F363B0|nr:site-specific DNA-methyltransferase [Enterococcus sp. S86.2]
MKDIPDGSIDMILTDPPYLMDYRSNRRPASTRFMPIQNDTVANGKYCIEQSFAEYERVLKSNTALYVFCSWHHIDFFKTEFQKHFTLKNIIVWNKNNHGSGDLRGAYAPKHEFILYGHKGRSIFREKRLPDVLEFPKVPSAKLLHPTEKPISLLNVFLRNNSDEGATVLDPFMGSGTTGVACKNLSRNFIGYELDDEYFEIAKERIEGALK